MSSFLTMLQTATDGLQWENNWSPQQLLNLLRILEMILSAGKHVKITSSSALDIVLGKSNNCYESFCVKRNTFSIFSIVLN